MDNKVNSYYSIEIKKTQEQLIEVLNNCLLPFSIKQLIMNNLSNIIDNYAQQEYEQDLQAYNQQLEEMKVEETKENSEDNSSEENN